MPIKWHLRKQVTIMLAPVDKRIMNNVILLHLLFLYEQKEK